MKDDLRFGDCNFCGKPAEEVAYNEAGSYVRLCTECIEHVLPRALAGSIKNSAWAEQVLFYEFDDAMARFAAEYWRHASLLIDHMHSRRGVVRERDLPPPSGPGGQRPDETDPPCMCSD